MLDFIATNIMGENNHQSILADFYEYVRKDDWKVLDGYKGINNASLETYLSKCAYRYFKKQKISLDKQKKNETELTENIPDMTSILEMIIEDMDTKENEKSQKLWTAFSKLKERDQKILRYQVIGNRSSLEIADEMWEYVHRRDNVSMDQLTSKQIQDTIALMKKRAIYYLCKLLMNEK
jgi:hypothetical protein